MNINEEKEKNENSPNREQIEQEEKIRAEARAKAEKEIKEKEKIKEANKQAIGCLTALVIIVLVVILFVLPDNGEEKNQKIVGSPPIKISAVQLNKEYDANKVAADQKYKDKIVEMSGIIDDIGKTILDKPYVIIKGKEYSPFVIQCMFDNEYKNKLANLSKEQSITVKCQVSSELIGYIILRDCVIVK